MKEIIKEDWDRVLDESNPNFEEDFNELVARYFIRTKKRYEKKNSQKDLKSLRIWLLLKI